MNRQATICAVVFLYRLGDLVQIVRASLVILDSRDQLQVAPVGGESKTLKADIDEILCFLHSLLWQYGNSLTTPVLPTLTATSMVTGHASPRSLAIPERLLCELP